MNQSLDIIGRLALSWFGRFATLRRSEGQTLVEYGLILLLIAVVVAGAVTVLGGGTKSLYSSIGSGV